MCEAETKMAMPLSNTPSKPTTQPQFVPYTPENPSRPTQEQGSRTRDYSTCFNCGKKGHWYRQCPLALHSNGSSPIPDNIYCRCGYGFCLVKTSKSTKNFGKKFYVCPIKEGKQCKGFIGFCNEPPRDEEYFDPPPYKYPVCECGAGVCAKERDPNADRKFRFLCPVQPGHGNCGFIVTEDELRGKQRIRGLSGSGELLVDYPESMTAMDISEAPSLNAIPEVPLGDDTSPKATPPRQVGLNEFEVIDDDLDAEDVNWDDFDKEAESFRSRFATGLTCRQNLFGNNSFNDAIGDNAPPTGTFTSYDEISDSEHPTAGDSPPECNQSTVTSLNEDAQLSSRGSDTTVLGQISGDDVMQTEVPGGVSAMLTVTQGTKRKLMSEAERRKKMVSYMLREFLTEIEDLDIHDHDSIRVAVDGCFKILQELVLTADYKLFSDHVWDYINNVSAIAEIDKSMENRLTLGESNRIIEEEKTKLAQIQEETVETEAMFIACNLKGEMLREEVLRMKAELHEKQNQLKSCELESATIESRLGDLKRRRLEADTKLMGRVEEAESARRLNEERQLKQMAAMAALEKLKHQLQN
ncbi:uncharacterized protein LOC130935130 [Arachis stenosperma]|uniref:uncharacterized protein LOC130935130 n=1 Tax=Arachis stenosperma TaxID=217475 RepID=UPI0025ACC2F7|nr:uncharacterized protein LOC130935130 [Arachis stenosperma]